ncbi:MAG: hypothetical protein K0V04_22000, partial [Deltaproteobacteria bacterium]|nr:hypothetical protein [Deltaproteobacteria bacterium]
LLDLVRGRGVVFGTRQVLMVVAGGWLMTMGLATGWPRAQRLLTRLSALAFATYVSLVVLEVLLAVLGPARATIDPVPALGGMSMEDPVVGYRHAPGWRGTYDDGVVQAEYVMNARGDRDDDAPVATATRRVLLLGDSFTFGQALPRAATIEARIEARGEGDVDAYNLGIPGYAAVHSRRRFEQSDWWRGDDVVYLYYRNDIQPGVTDLDYMRVLDGHAVPRRGPDGVEYTQQQLVTELEAALAVDPTRARWDIGSRLALSNLRTLVRALLDSELRLTSMPSESVQPALVDELVEHLQAIEAQATSRGARFHFVMLPTAPEAGERTWSKGSTLVIERARAAGLEPITDLLERLDAEAYLQHDGHFAPGGADQAAALILERL